MTQSGTEPHATGPGQRALGADRRDERSWFTGHATGTTVWRKPEQPGLATEVLNGLQILTRGRLVQRAGSVLTGIGLPGVTELQSS